jgi:hypothetical protein
MILIIIKFSSNIRFNEILTIKKEVSNGQSLNLSHENIQLQRLKEDQTKTRKIYVFKKMYRMDLFNCYNP